MYLTGQADVTVMLSHMFGEHIYWFVKLVVELSTGFSAPLDLYYRYV